MSDTALAPGTALRALEEAVRLRDIASEGVDRAINGARQAGWSWDAIAEAVGRKDRKWLATVCRSRGIY